MLTGAKTVYDTSELERGQVGHVAWSPDGSTMTYYRGEIPHWGFTMSPAPNPTRQITRLPDGSFREPRTITLDPTNPFLLPVWALSDGRILLRSGGDATVQYIANPASSAVNRITLTSTGEPVEVTDALPDGRVVYRILPPSMTVQPDPHVSIGRVSANGAVTPLATFSYPHEGGWMFDGRFTPTFESVQSITITGSGGRWGIAQLSPPDEFMEIMANIPGVYGHDAITDNYAIIAVGSYTPAIPKYLWIASRDQSISARVGTGFFPTVIPICEA
jgi:hypothetical protein